MKIRILTIGKLKEKYLVNGINEYVKRLNAYCKVEMVEVPDEPIPDNASENVELPLIYRGIDRKTRHELAIESLKMGGLEKRMDHKPTEMSGGQQQRVAIARALAAAPPLILADEPTGNLDSKSSREIMEILRKLHTEGRTVILITHDDKIAQSAKRIIRIMDGKIESDSGMADKNSMEEENGEE